MTQNEVRSSIVKSLVPAFRAAAQRARDRILRGESGFIEWVQPTPPWFGHGGDPRTRMGFHPAGAHLTVSEDARRPEDPPRVFLYWSVGTYCTDRVEVRERKLVKSLLKSFVEEGPHHLLCNLEDLLYTLSAYGLLTPVIERANQIAVESVIES